MVNILRSHLNGSRLNEIVSAGGDVNVTDQDGDTPLYVVENVETARYLVEHGANTNRQNDEGLSVRHRLAHIP